MKATAKDLIGRTIVAVDFQPFPVRPAYPGDPTEAHDPIITLDNGVKVFFITEETDVGEYGTAIHCILPLPPPRRKRNEAK